MLPIPLLLKVWPWVLVDHRPALPFVPDTSTPPISRRPRFGLAMQHGVPSLQPWGPGKNWFLSGILRDAMGTPVPNVDLTVYLRRTSAAVAMGRTGADGSFKIAVLANDSYDIIWVPPVSGQYTLTGPVLSL